MKSKSGVRILTVCAAVVLGANASAASAATLVVGGGGELLGAIGVAVGGSFYDVTFQGGTCAAVFEGCDSNSDFIFNDAAAALQASQSLLDQVFIGSFDTDPALTLGCADAIESCTALVPFQVDNSNFVETRGAVNLMGTIPDFVGDANLPKDLSLQGFTFAKFTAATAGAVPEPSTWAMMLLGFFSVGGAMRFAKRQQKLTVSHA